MIIEMDMSVSKHWQGIHWSRDVSRLDWQKNKAYIIPQVSCLEP